MTEQKEKGYFESEITISKETLTELKKHFMPPKQVLAYRICIVVSAFLMILSYGGQHFGLGSFFLFMFVMCINLYIQLPRNMMNSIIAKNLELTEKEDCIQRLVFYSDEIENFDPDTNNINRINYRHLFRLVETENTFTIFTKAHIIMVVDKASLIKEQKKEDFILFMREKCRGLIIKRSKR